MLFIFTNLYIKMMFHLKKKCLVDTHMLLIIIVLDFGAAKQM